MKSSNYILHLPSWYPNKYKPLEVSYLKDQITLLSCIKQGVVACVIENREVDQSFDIKENFENHVEYLRYIPLRKGLLRYLLYFVAYFRLVQKILNVHGKPYLSHVHILFKAGLIGLMLKIRYNIKYITTEHYSIYLDNDLTKSKSYIIKFSCIVGRFSDIIISVSNLLKENILKYCTKTKVFTIYNYVNTDLFNIANTNRLKHKMTFLHISHLENSVKNVEGIIEAFSLLHKDGFEFELKIVGSNDKNLQILRSNNKLISEFQDKITFYGQQNSECISTMMKESHVLVMFSNFETFSIVIAEALCTGMYVISSDSGGPIELLSNKECGTLVKVNDILQLKIELEKVITDVKIDHTKIAQQSCQRFDKDQFIANYTSLYS